MKRLLPLGMVFFLLSLGFSMNVMKAPGKINSGHTDVAPVPSPDGQVLYFTSERPGGQGGQDLWVSHFAGGVWTEPKPLPGALNSKFNEGADSIAYERDNIYMYMTLCNRPEGKGMCDLYVSTYNKNGSWSEPKNLGAPVNGEFSESNSFFDSSENILYFTSNRPGGLGAGTRKGASSYDFWYSERKPDGSFSEPKNLGSGINTADSEERLFLDAATGWLFFSSDGHGGKGGLDIFKAKKLGKGSWGPALSVDAVNSEGNDSYLSIAANSDFAFFSSNAYGDDEIYSILLAEILSPSEISARKQFYWSNCPPAVPAVGELAKAMNEKKFCEPIKVASTGPVVMAPPIDDEVGKKKTVYFQLNQSALTARAQSDLAPWADWLKSNGGKKIEISGYTDSLGDKVYNQDLSRRRAQAVKSWLESQGAQPELISIKYYGMENPAEPNDPVRGNPKNRRAEITVVE